MKDSRTKRVKLNMLTMLIRQLLATLCGIVIPRAMIGAFGSVAYGATTSIAQFLSYVSLLEGGIGRVARGALYKPLARGDWEQVSKIYRAVKFFFRNIGIIFIAYTLILAFTYHDIADIMVFDRGYTVALVLAISMSMMATYFGGISNMTLMHADQKQYLTNTIITVTNVINTLLIVILINLKADVLTVKLVSSIVFIFRPILYSGYVKRKYDLPHTQRDDSALSQKWTGIGQHVAYFLHTNTDIVMLTLLADLKMVAVYSVYNLVVKSIWNIASSFSGGMEATFGEMIAKRERDALRKSYLYYKSIITIMAMALFTCAGILIIPFIKLYTADISDADYIQPAFALVLLLAEYMNCLTLPCTTLPISANCLRQTRWGSYGEACINISVSLLLIRWNPLLGVALGTLFATIFKCIYYMNYSAKEIIQCSVWSVILKFLASLAVMSVISTAGMHLMNEVRMENYLMWCGWGVLTFLAISVICLIFCAGVFPREMKDFTIKIVRKFQHLKN